VDSGSTSWRDPEVTTSPPLSAALERNARLAAKCAPVAHYRQLGAVPVPCRRSLRALSRPARAVLGLLREAARAGYLGLYASARESGSLTGYSERTIYRALAELADRGLVTRTSTWEPGDFLLPIGGGQCRRYTVRQTASVTRLTPRGHGQVVPSHWSIRARAKKRERTTQCPEQGVTTRHPPSPPLGQGEGHAVPLSSCTSEFSADSEWLELVPSWRPHPPD
jgi:hypothetical protein